MWRCFGKGHTLTPQEAPEQDEEIIQGEALPREDSIYRYYVQQYWDQQQQLERLLEQTADSYAEQCALEVLNGTRSQAVITQIKTLKKELRLCQFKSLRQSSAMDASRPLPSENPDVSQRDTAETPLPEWITRELRKPKALTSDQLQRAQLQAASSFLTIAGHELSTERPLRYFEIFNLYESDGEESMK